MTVGRVSVGGAELAYRSLGSGPTIIWGHGLTSSMQAEDAAALVDWREAAGRSTVIRYDARGHGGSDSTPDTAAYSWQALAGDQLALADQLGVDRFVAGGASMGAGTALHVAVTAPERVRALVLLLPPTGWEGRAGQAELYTQMADVVERYGVEPLIDASATIAPPDPFAGLEGYQQVRADGLRAWDRARLAQVFRGATTAQLPDRDALAAIDVPALVLAWSGDEVHPVSTAEELGRLLPDVEVEVAHTLEDVVGGAGTPNWTGRVRSFVEQVG